MTARSPSARRRAYRKPLVLAAERVLTHVKPPEKTQFNNLIAACSEAACVAEIENWLRYQSSRRGSPWDHHTADAVIEAVRPTLAGIQALDDLDEAERERDQVEAWRLYATYLMRAATYLGAVRQHKRDNG